ncbi:MAG: glutamate--cysteine ligase [Thiotrichaceae bacterium]
MYNLLNKRLESLIDNKLEHLLQGSKTGLEKESLRVTPEGRISQTKHPKILGAALTHPYITTDYSESLLEFITPPLSRASEALDFLLDIETFVYQKLDDELLWTTSMPCVIGGESDIHIAEYGTSNAGKMKSVYRQGLASRYGKMMQVIAGIHFNHSFPLKLWPVYQQLEGNNDSEQDFIDQSYMALTRNLLRYGWLIPYLFGSSPAICNSFLDGIKMPENMKIFNKKTSYEPHGTSLRMGDIGYTNLKEGEAGVKANYNSLAKYTRSLREAITTPFPAYEKIGVKVDGKYRQLNANLLQIENEYYSTVRPKQILKYMEKPVDALDQRGIQYVELRSLDINAFHPAGLTHKQLYFLKTFMLFCLLQESPDIDMNERREIDSNQSRVAHLGRKPGLTLSRNDESVSLKSWAEELLHAMAPVAELLGDTYGENCYQESHELHLDLVRHPELTPSARLLEELFSNNENYYEFARRKSLEHRDIFLNRTLPVDKEKEFIAMAASSLQEQKRLEAKDKEDFDTFLANYFS